MGGAEAEVQSPYSTLLPRRSSLSDTRQHLDHNDSSCEAHTHCTHSANNTAAHTAFVNSCPALHSFTPRSVCVETDSEFRTFATRLFLLPLRRKGRTLGDREEAEGDGRQADHAQQLSLIITHHAATQQRERERGREEEKRQCAQCIASDFPMK